MTSNSSHFESNLAQEFQEGCKRYIDLMARIRAHVGNKVKFPLPTIVMVGDQGCGKSSILEYISGINLPKSQGITTRVPLEMRLSNSQIGWNGTIEYTNLSGNRVTKLIEDVERTRDLILEAQNEMCATLDDVSTETIILTISARNMPNMILVDLPGIVASEVGDQPEGTAYKIEEITKSYITRQNIIILQVLTSTIDVENHHTTKILKREHPNISQTISVFTKSDICEDRAYTLAANCENNRYAFKEYHFLCSQIRNNNNFCNSQQRMDSEEDFFKSLDGIKFEYCGMRNFLPRLVGKLAEAIKRYLPTLKNEISKQILQSEEALEKLPIVNENFVLMASEMINNFLNEIRKLLTTGFTFYPRGNEAAEEIAAHQNLHNFLSKKNLNELISQLDLEAQQLVNEQELFTIAKSFLDSRNTANLQPNTENSNLGFQIDPRNITGALVFKGRTLLFTKEVRELLKEKLREPDGQWSESQLHFLITHQPFNGIRDFDNMPLLLQLIEEYSSQYCAIISRYLSKMSDHTQICVEYLVDKSIKNASLKDYIINILEKIQKSLIIKAKAQIKFLIQMNSNIKYLDNYNMRVEKTNRILNSMTCNKLEKIHLLGMLNLSDFQPELIGCTETMLNIVDKLDKNTNAEGINYARKFSFALKTYTEMMNQNLEYSIPLCVFTILHVEFLNTIIERVYGECTPEKLALLEDKDPDKEMRNQLTEKIRVCEEIKRELTKSYL